MTGLSAEALRMSHRRARDDEHTQTEKPFCVECGETWPCTVSALLDLLADRERHAEARGAVRALREAAEGSLARCWCPMQATDPHNAIRHEVATYLRDRADRLAAEADA